MNPSLLLATLLAFAPFYLDRGAPPDDRAAALRPVAEAIAAAARTREEAAALLELGEAETHFALLVLAGRCGEMPAGMRCDPDARGRPRARGPWQVWRWCRATALEGEARCALSVLRMGVARCGSWEGAFEAAAGRGGCTSRKSAARVQEMRRILARWESR